MRRVIVAVVMSLATLAIAPVVAQTAAAAPPTQLISVSGSGVDMYPNFAVGTLRYGVTTTDTTAGTVTVTGSTSDPTGSVWIDGQPAVDGTATLSGLTSGAEISVFIKDSSGTTAYSLIYLPAGFPALTVATKQPGIAPGDVFLTLSDDTGTTPGYETAVDNNGVPVYVRSESGVPSDFKRQPNGDYSVWRTVAGTEGGQVVELNSKFRQIATYQTLSPLTNTDDHDSILLPNGDAWLLSDMHNDATGLRDAVIQEQSPAGKILFQWDSADHVDVATDGLGFPVDYAHINSIALMKNGDILASFRNLSQVMDIATSARSGIKVGDVVWMLGGRLSTFTFPNDPNGGPCAQHTASQLPNGDILMFDDGSESINGSPLLCVDPADRAGPTVARPQTRVVEYSLDTSANPPTATIVWSWQVTGGPDAAYAGSARRQSNGDTLVGWGGTGGGKLATEVNQSGDVIWDLSDNPSNLISYRALRYPAPDAIPPVVEVTQPAKGADFTVGQKVSSDFSCTDRGGSNLRSCNGSVVEGAAIDTSTPGIHTFSVVAKDGAGNTTTVTRKYHVGMYQPDALIKKLPAGAYRGGNVYGGIANQQIKESIASSGKSALALARFQNDGAAADRLTIKGSAGTARFRVRYFAGARNVTSDVTAGTYETPGLAPGQSFKLRVKVTRTAAAKPGNSKTVKLKASSVNQPTRHDAVATIVRAVH